MNKTKVLGEKKGIKTLLAKCQETPQQLTEIKPLDKELQYLATRQATRLQQLATHAVNTNLSPLLSELQQAIIQINPCRYSLSHFSLRAWLSSLLPWINTPLQNYCADYQTQHPKISLLIQKLNTKNQQLQRDTSTLQYDAKDTEDYIQQLMKALDDSKALNQQFELEQQRLKPLQQRIFDLNLQLTVAEQALLSLQLIISNNQQFIQKVNEITTAILSVLQVNISLSTHLSKPEAQINLQMSFNSIEKLFQSLD